MSRSALSVFFALLLVASLAMKFSVQARTPVEESAGTQPARLLLEQQGFTTQESTPGTDPSWLIGDNGGCQVWIANVSPQGWHREPVEWFASGKNLRYSVGGELYDQQPIFKTLFAHYFSRAQRYFGLSAPQPRVLAIVSSRQCPDGVVATQELASLSAANVER